jgi:hypothetical protein
MASAAWREEEEVEGSRAGLGQDAGPKGRERLGQRGKINGEKNGLPKPFGSKTKLKINGLHKLLLFSIFQQRLEFKSQWFKYFQTKFELEPN